MSFHGALLAAALMFASAAPAQRDRVAVSVSDGALQQRLVAELVYLGFEPVVVPPSEQRLGLEHATVAISEGTDGTHLEIVVLESGRAATEPIDVPAHGPDARDLAIRTAELVRVSLERARSVPAVSPAPVDAPAPSEPPVPERFGATLGPAVTGAPGGLHAAAMLRIGLRYMPHRTYGIALAGTAPLHAVRVTGREGTADLWFGWVTLGARFAFRSPEARVRPELGLGAGVFVLTATADPSASYRARRASLVTGLAELSGGVEFKVSRLARIRTMAALATCFTRPEVHFAGRMRAHTCMPMALGEVALTIAW